MVWCGEHWTPTRREVCELDFSDGPGVGET